MVAVRIYLMSEVSDFTLYVKMVIWNAKMDMFYHFLI